MGQELYVSDPTCHSNILHASEMLLLVTPDKSGKGELLEGEFREEHYTTEGFCRSSSCFEIAIKKRPVCLHSVTLSERFIQQCVALHDTLVLLQLIHLFLVITALHQIRTIPKAAFLFEPQAHQ